MKMKKVITLLLTCVLFYNTTGLAIATPVVLGAAAVKSDKIEYKKNAQTITYAFVFDGPSKKNEAITAQFEKAITKTTAPDYKAGFSKANIFVGDWTEHGAKIASDKALNSNSVMVISLGYLSTKYLNETPNKKKFVITIDQYGLRDMGGDFFNPVQQSVKGALLFKRLINFHKTAILMNESFYKTKKDWNGFLAPKLPGVAFEVMPVNNDNVDTTIQKLSTGYDAVILTPLFNLDEVKKHDLINKINLRKLPTFSTLGREDVADGVLLGAGAYDLDRKLAEATSFNIKGVINGDKAKLKKIQFYEDEIVYINQDTADSIGYDPHLRVLNNAEIISNKPPTIYNLSTVFDTLYAQNIDIERKKLLVKAARRASLAAVLKYLPSLNLTLGYQQYNHDYADSASLLLPEKTGVFQAGLEQVIYSPALVTNILVKKKMVDFSKQEEFLTEQNMGIDVALLYIETLMLENMVTVQKEEVKESRENLAIARVREKMGNCGREEALRWATQLLSEEEELLGMTADLKNLKIAINKLLNKDQKESFKLASLKANDASFYTKDIKIIDYVITPKALEQFTEMLIGEAYRVAPELSKLRAAKKMKQYEMAMYYQKFILPDAKLNLTYTSLLNREFAKDTVIPSADMRSPAAIVAPGNGNTYLRGTPITLPHSDATNLQLGIFAQWKPIEGGTKIAEIARLKAEIEELDRYQDQAKTAIEEHIRGTINKAVAGYFSIEKNYKAMSASGENFKKVQDMYLKGEIPITHMLDAQNVYKTSRIKAMNSQYEFFKELFWVQRGICAVDWAKASPEAKQFIESVKQKLEKRGDIEFL